jgi:DNA-binding transcriptional ArsR family regulator
MAETLDRKTLKALSIETRQEIVRLLSKRPYTASELSKKLEKHVTTVSEHLKVLEDAGLIKKNPDGHKWIYFTLADKGEKIFKPQFYSWVVVLSLSFIMVFFGVLQIFQVDNMSASSHAPQAVSEKVDIMDSAPVACGVSYQVPSEFWTGMVLVALGLFGIGYLIGKKIH